MDKKKKLLWVGDAAVNTGFARVGHSVLEHLKETYDVHVLGINYRGDPHPYNYPIYPAILGGDIMGIRRLVPMVEQLKPDVIAILQDPWILDVYLHTLKTSLKPEQIPPILTYFPVDAAGLSKTWFENFDIVKSTNVYTEFAKFEVSILEVPGLCCSNVNIIPHGVDLNTFYPLDKEKARESMFPKNRLDDFNNSFIVLNANRNQPRKRIDLSILGFRQFAKDKKDVKLFLHMGMIDEGINVIEACQTYGISDKLIVTSMEQSIPNLTSDKLNIVYNAADVGFNTSTGEGWGLTNWEHAATGRPQVVPNHSACFELWHEQGAFIFPAKDPVLNPKINTRGYVARIEDIATGLEAAYAMWKKNRDGFDDMGKQALELVSRPEYRWNNIAEQFKVQIERIS